MKKSEYNYKTYWVYPVELTGANGVSVLAAEMDDASPALELGGQIAVMLRLPLRDETETTNKDDFEEEEEFAEENGEE